MAKKKTNSRPAVPNWNMFIALVNFTLFIIVISFGYLLLEKDIQKWLNQGANHTRSIDNIRGAAESDDEDLNKIINGIHLRSGLYADPNLQTIIGACTSCHSSKLIVQNKATREGWEQMIRWMQKSQGLGDLGNNETLILDYLSKYYAPKKEGRRPNLDMEDLKWYMLDIE